MKYKRKNKANQKYVSELKGADKKSTLKKSDLKKRSVIAASITVMLFCASRMGLNGVNYVKKLLFSNNGNTVMNYIESKAPFLDKIGSFGADFVFGYLKGEGKGKKAVFAKDEDKSGGTTPQKESDKAASSDASAQSVQTSDTFEIPKEPTAPSFDPAMPCSGKISSPFGQRTHPVSGQGGFHNGMDIAANPGTEVTATESGTVEKSRYDQFSGNLIVIRHTDEYTSSYAHLSQSFVSEGQTVKKGDVIGLVGSTGISTGPHLHIEIRKNGEPVDPNSFYKVS